MENREKDIRILAWNRGVLLEAGINGVVVVVEGIISGLAPISGVVLAGNTILVFGGPIIGVAAIVGSTRSE